MIEKTNIGQEDPTDHETKRTSICDCLSKIKVLLDNLPSCHWIDGIWMWSCLWDSARGRIGWRRVPPRFPMRNQLAHSSCRRKSRRIDVDTSTETPSSWIPAVDKNSKTIEREVGDDIEIGTRLFNDDHFPPSTIRQLATADMMYGFRKRSFVTFRNNHQCALAVYVSSSLSVC